MSTWAGRASETALPVLLGVLLATPAGAWRVDAGADPEALADFHRQLASAAYLYPRHEPRPLTRTGLEVYLETTYNGEAAEEGRLREALDGDLPGGALAVARLGARKGLPGGVDLGAAWGRVVDSEISLFSGELQWAFLRGRGCPELAVRATASRSTGSDSYDLSQYGVELLAGGGLGPFGVYGGAGVVRSEGDFATPTGRLAREENEEVLYAGISLDLLLPRLTLELEQGASFQVAVRLALGW